MEGRGSHDTSLEERLGMGGLLGDTCCHLPGACFLPWSSVWLQGSEGGRYKLRVGVCGGVLSGQSEECVPVSRGRGGVCSEPETRSVEVVKARRCQPLRVRLRECPTEVCVQCPHPQPLFTAGDFQSPLLAAPSYPSREGQAGRWGKLGRGPLGLGVCGGGGFWSAVWSHWEGRWGGQMRGLWRGLGDVGLPSRGSARELGGGGRSLALPLGGDLSLPAPSPRRRRLPLVWPRRPRPRPRPAPARSLPSRRRGRGRGPGRRAPGSAGPLPFPARQLPALPALPRAAGAERPLPPLPGQ